MDWGRQRRRQQIDKVPVLGNWVMGVGDVGGLKDSIDRRAAAMIQYGIVGGMSFEGQQLLQIGSAY